MTINQDFRTAVQLTATARAASENLSGGLFLEQYLPSRENATLSYELADTSQAQIDSAEFRAFDTEAPYGRTVGNLTKSGKLPPISKKLPVSELSQLRMMGQADALGVSLERYAAQLGQEVAVRLELARGEAIEKGKLTLNENGLQFTIDYGRRPDHTAAAAVKWDQETAKPLDDILNWVQAYTANTGTAPENLLISRRTLSYLSKNKDLIQAAVGNSNAPSRVSFNDVISTLASYGIGQTIVFDKAYGGKRVVADNVAVFLPTPGGATVLGGVLGTTDYGIPAEALKPSYGIPASEQAGIFCGSFERTDPEGLDVLASAIALPVLQNANASFAATVL
ncbi:major capsid protein [Arthrobacter russicus]|uniref:Major capsid protein E n=2 Tax=Bacillati TaxID=1783272 RepID=A0ABU1JE00_9MICC|nr:major capsid protein [Arthrobacter russicus]MDR6270600.1 hypothetical protein [Arthrobacter russicus]